MFVNWIALISLTASLSLGQSEGYWAQARPAATPAPALAPTPPTPPLPPPAAIQLLTGSGSFLGVNVVEVDAARAKELKLKDEHGVEITNVESDSPAEKAGLKKGDVVLDYNGQRVEGTEQFIRLVRETPGGRSAKLTISRNGATQSLAATIGSRKNKLIKGELFSGQNWPGFQVNVPDVPRPYMGLRSGMIGIEAEGVEGQLAQFFGVKEGVLVRGVTKGSPAEKAGLRAGDVITKVDSTEVGGPRDLTNAVRSRGNKRNVSLTLMRDKKEMSVSVAFGEEQGQRMRPGPVRRVSRQEGEFRF